LVSEESPDFHGFLKYTPANGRFGPGLMSVTRFFFLFLAAGSAVVRADDLPVVEITTPPGQMKYDRPVIIAKPGSQLKIVFRNNDEMPHNIVFCRPAADGANDKGMAVAQEAWTLAEKGMDLAWIPPNHPRIWAHSKLVAAHQSEEIILKVPEQAGIYPYVCTFPGHAMAMNGELRVAEAGPGFDDVSFQLYLGDWSQLPDFRALKPHREGPLKEKLVDIQLEGMTEHFGLVFEGTLTAPEEGNYRFLLASDDGSRLFVDDKQVIDNNGTHPGNDVRNEGVKLSKGPHKVRLEYFEGSGQEELYFAWAGPKFSETALSKWIHPSRREGGGDRPQNQPPGMPLIPKDGEALMYRNFIAGASSRGIAVGYPNGVNVVFDAGRFSLPLIWRGAFVDARQHWTDRGGGEIQPLGFGTVSLTGDRPGLARLKDKAAPWPAGGPRAEGIQFLGYQMDAKRFPTFRYRMGDALVTERIEPAGDYKTSDERLSRVLRLALAPDDLYVRVAAGSLKQDGSHWILNDALRIGIAGGEALLRDGNELLVRPALANGSGEITVAMEWLNR
jgi:azurin